MRSFLVTMVVLGLVLACRATQELPAKVLEFRLRFEGHSSLEAEELDRRAREELARLEVVRLDRAALDDVAFALELFYQERGHARVAIAYALETGPNGEPGAVFRIDEGPAVRVRTLIIEGVTALQPEYVREQLSRFDAGRSFDSEGLGRALDRLREDYLERGHMALVLEAPEIVFHEDDTVSIAVRIQEGPGFRVSEVRLEGGAPELAARLGKRALNVEGAPYVPGIERALEASLLEDHARNGYPDASITLAPMLDAASGNVILTCRIDSGPRVTIENIRIVGNVRTREHAILAALGLEVGTPYDSEELRRAFRELYALGLFDSIELRLEGEDEQRALVVEVQETRSVEIRFEPGWGSYEGPRLLLGIAENNFRGAGELLVLEGTVSLKARGVRSAWIDRNLLGTRMTGEVTFGVEQREEPSYEFVRQTFGAFVRQPFAEDWQSTFGYEFRPTRLTDQSSGALAPDLVEDTEIGSLSTGLSVDSRDNPLLPSRGRYGRARLEWADDAFASDTEFLRVHLEYAHLLRLRGEGVLAASLRTGVMTPFGLSDDVPITERFFNGGENTVRSFREDELGPKDTSGEPIGGESATTINLEYRHSLAGSLAGALFVDTGNVVLESNDYLRFDDFRWGLGGGLYYLLPIGPVRADLAWNPDAGASEDDWVLHVSVGFAF